MTDLSREAEVAEAVKAERERCAQVADRFAARAEKRQSGYRGGSNPWDRYRALAATYSRIAAAIREESE